MSVAELGGPGDPPSGYWLSRPVIQSKDSRIQCCLGPTFWGDHLDHHRVLSNYGSPEMYLMMFRGPSDARFKLREVAVKISTIPT